MRSLLVLAAVATSACLVVPDPPEQPVEDAGEDLVDGLEIVTRTLPNAVVDADYSQQVSIRGGAGPFQFELSGAPPWLAIHPQTGQLFGRPSAIHPDVNATVTVRDSLTSQSVTYAVRTTACQPGLRYACSSGVDGSCLLGTRLCQEDGRFGACDASQPSDDETRCGPSCEPCGGAGLACVDGRCTCGATADATCTGGATCCMSSTGSSCTDVSTDTNNCGQCGAVCEGHPDAAQHLCPSCAAGECGPLVCCAEYDNCDLTNPDCETHLPETVTNCGACGNDCTSKANVAEVDCNASTCVVLSCDTQWEDCDGLGATGCEANTIENSDGRYCGTDQSSCTACWDKYPGVNVRVDGWNCQAGICRVDPPTAEMIFGGCVTGYFDCNGKPEDGCERQQDDANCGGCNDVCSDRPQVAVGTCVKPDGVCQIQDCDASWGNCDGNVENGCETFTDTSDAHCGSCNNACDPGTTCVSGGCCEICTAGCSAGTSIACCSPRTCGPSCNCVLL